MKKNLIFIWFLFCSTELWSQIIVPDFQVNDGSKNFKGIGRPAIAAITNGTFAVAWQDYNDYENPIAEQPRVAVQLFNSLGAAVGSLNLFQGETRTLDIWTSDYLTSNIDIGFMQDGVLLVALEHQGDLSIGGDNLISSECGLGAINNKGEIIDLSESSAGVVLWLSTTSLRNYYHPRLAIAPDGQFFYTLDGETYETHFNAVAVQEFDANGNFVGDFFTPHTDDPGPQSNHRYPDIATNGDLLIVVWQDGRQDVNYDINAQFYNNNGAFGGNIKVNQGDPDGTLNLLPSVSMNTNGNSIVVWADTRNNTDGEIYGQLFDNEGKAVGANFQISSGEGKIWDRPEVTMLDDESFFVVWTDSAGATGIKGLKARGRQFDAAGNPITPTFIIPDQDVPSGLVTIASDGSKFYLAWVDDRLNNGNPHVYAKVVTKLFTDAEILLSNIPESFHLNQNYPNPFNPSTIIKYSIPNKGLVTLKVYNTIGEEVATLVNELEQAGNYEVEFNASSMPSGVYFYKLQVGDFVDAKKMILLK
jgi:Secretion system C-terminal sorting domain